MDIPAELLKGAEALNASRWTEAEAIYRAVLEVDPTSAVASYNLGAAIAAVGRYSGAEPYFRAAVTALPAAPAPRFGLGRALMAQGRHREASGFIDSRYDLPQLKMPRPGYAGAPQWAGEYLAGKKLLIFPEQGLGDQIMLARFAPKLAEMGGDITLLCHPALVDLFSGLGVRVIGASGAVSFPKPDYITTLTDLPCVMGLDRDDVWTGPYLKVSERPWHSEGFHIGVATNGNPVHANDRTRSLFGEDARRLLDLPGRVHSLSPDAAGDMNATAALISKLDLVVTVDTSIGHLAGALGKPVWILVPAVQTDWRWGEVGSPSSPRYPDGRLFWSAADGSWAETLNAVHAEAMALSQRHTAPVA